MDADWTLIEYRPGRYARVSSDGTFLGVASDEEVRAWFASMGRPVRRQPDRQPPSTAQSKRVPAGESQPAPEPEAPWEKPLIWGRKPPPARPEETTEVESEPDATWARPMLWGRPPDSSTPHLELPDMPSGEQAGKGTAPGAAPVEPGDRGATGRTAAGTRQQGAQPRLPERFLTLDLRKPEPEPGQPGAVSVPDANGPAPGQASGVSIPDAKGPIHPEEPPPPEAPGGVSIPDANAVARPEEPPPPEAPSGVSIPDANAMARPEESPPPKAPSGVSIPDANGPAHPQEPQGDTRRPAHRHRKPVQVTMELPGLETGSPGTQEEEAGSTEVGGVPEEPPEPPREAEIELTDVEVAEGEPLVEEAEPDALQATPDELEESPEASDPELPLLDAGEPWPEEVLIEDEDAGPGLDFEPSTPPPTRSSKPVAPEAGDTGEDGQEADAPDTGNLWLWVDPRYEGGYNPATFDLAGFLQRAIVLFQTKPWAGGNRPGRIAVHSDQTDESLGPVAERLGLAVIEDDRVSDGTYWLGLGTDE